LALGIGVDYPNIVYILYVRVLYSIIDFAQELGRRGRRGKAVDLVILVEEEDARRL
jgi:superfamily II DNA helicase RecQ